MKAWSLLLGLTVCSGCVVDQHLGIVWNTPDAGTAQDSGGQDVDERDVNAPDLDIEDIAPQDVPSQDLFVQDIRAPDTSDTGPLRDATLSDVGTLDSARDTGTLDPDGHASTSSASCTNSCECVKAEACFLECTGAAGCAASCGISRTCSVRLLGRSNSADCRSAESCDVACSASCDVDCGSSRCKIACAPGERCTVKCGNTSPTLCPGGAAIVCNGHEC